MAVNTRNSIVTNGLIMYLDSLNPKSYTSGSTTWYDISGNSRNGSLTNIVGGNNNVPLFTSPSGSNVNFSTNTLPVDQFTINTTIKILNITSSGFTYMFMNGSTYSTRSFYSEISNANLGVNCTFGNSSSYGAVGMSGIGITTGSTYDLTHTYDGTTLKYYRNAVLINQVTVSQPLPGQGNFTFGVGYNYSPNANVYRIMAYNRALTPQEVLQNYITSKTRYNTT